MSAIEQVIARARMASDVGFAQRRQFKLARTRAIEKLRRFALADPYFYILELIQAAVASGAGHVSITCHDGDVLVSWTGGAIAYDDLAQLFDFLFASKERLDLAQVRSLALGINALLLFEPEEVMIESGDGSPGGTARMVVRAGSEAVDVGRAQGALRGTFVRARGLDRDKVGRELGRHGDDGGGLEYATVELRCLAAPVPVVFNGQPLFGWSRQRVPSLFGYRRVHSFDEGELYGTIGLDPHGEPSFQLLTHGVWIQSYTHELIPGQRMGGIVCFDRLRKTVDHSGFVRDELFEELWLRLLPYAEALVGGRVEVAPRITGAEGLAFTPNQLRDRLRQNPRVVVVEPHLRGQPEAHTRAQAIARALAAELLYAGALEQRAIRVLSGRELLLWRPDVSDDEDARLYGQPEDATPSGAQLLPPAAIEAPSQLQLLDLLEPLEPLVSEPAESGQEAQAGGEVDRRRAALRWALGDTGTITATLYTPAEPEAALRGLEVVVASLGRTLGRRVFASAYAGRVLVVDLPTASPTAMARDGGALLEAVAEHFAALAEPQLREQDRRSLAGLGVGTVEPGTAPARLALQVLARATVARLRAARPGRLSPGLGLSLLAEAEGFDPLRLPLLRSVAGEAIDLRGLVLGSDDTGGLVYGTVPEVHAALEGLDTGRILALERSSERVLIGLLGEAGYVRVDAREVLSEHDGVLVRDVAVGLRSYPDFPLLVEGEGVEARLAELDEGGREALLRALIAGLRRVIEGQAELTGDPGEHEEHRRQALRHLQWFVCRQLAGGRRDRVEALGLLDYPLFLDLDERAWGIAPVLAALHSEDGLLVHYGQALGAAELGTLVEAARSPAPSTGQPSSLAVSSFVHRLLRPLGRLRLAFDFDLDDAEARANPMTADTALLVRQQIAAPWGAGVLGVPASADVHPRIQLRRGEQGAIVALDELARVYGVVGSVELVPGRAAANDEGDGEAILAALEQQSRGLLEELVARLPAFADDPPRTRAALRVLLHYAGEQLQLVHDDEGLAVDLLTPLAERIVALPLFDVGGPTLASARGLLARFCRCYEREGPAVAHGLDWRSLLAADTPELLLAWLERQLDPSRIVRPASHARVEPVAAVDWLPGRPLTPELLSWNLTHWLERLRPDPRHGREGRPLPPTTVEVVPWGELEEGQLALGGVAGLQMAASHALVRRTLERPTPRHLAWLLIGAYAQVNAMSGSVLNGHELQFQRRVSAALRDGSLVPLQPHAEVSTG